MSSLPKITVVELMAFVALVAVDCAGYLSPRSFERILTLWLLPVVNALVIGLVVLTRQVVHRGVSSSFWLGFEAFGWAASCALAVITLGSPELVTGYQRTAGRAVEDFWMNYVKIDGGFTYTYWDDLRAFFWWAVVAVLPLSAAALGGGLTRRLDVVVVRSGGVSGLSGVEIDGSAAVQARRTRSISGRRISVIAAVSALIFVIAIFAASMKGRRDRYLWDLERHTQGERESLNQITSAERELARLPEGRARSSSDMAGASEAAELRRLVAENRARFDYHGRLKLKYAEAVRRPWLSVPPDPPYTPSVDNSIPARVSHPSRPSGDRTPSRRPPASVHSGSGGGKGG
jgi:hypothetical protein